MREVEAWLEEWGVPFERVEVHPKRKIVQVFLPDGRLTEFPPAWVEQGKSDLVRGLLRHYIPASGGVNEVEASRPARIPEE